MRLLWDLERIRKGCVISLYKLQNVLSYYLIKLVNKILGIRNSEIWLFDDVKIFVSKGKNGVAAWLPPPFWCLILMTWRACCNTFTGFKNAILKIGMPVFSRFMNWSLKSCILKPVQMIWLKLNHKLFISRKIKNWNAGGGGNPPSFICPLEDRHFTS